MSQGWNRQFQNLQRLMDEYVRDVNLKDQGFQLGESSNLRRPGNFNLGESGPMKTGKTVPTVYQQPRIQSQAALPGRNTISLSASQKPLLLTTSGKPLPNPSSVINLGGDVGQIAYRLPDGTYTSNKVLADIANQQIARAKNIVNKNAVAKDAIGLAKGTRGAIKTGISYIPYVGDVWDIGEGAYQATHGHPFVGTGQAALGALGLGANIFFPEAGTLAKTGVKSGVKKLAKALAYLSPNVAKGVRGYAKFNRSVPGQLITGGIPEVYYGIADTLNSASNGNTSNGSGNNTGGSTGTNGVKGKGRIGSQPTTQAQAIALAQQLGSNPPVTNQQEADTQRANINAINDYVSKLQEINQPYINALQSYSDRYDDLVKNNFNTQRYFTAMAGLTGNNNYARLADSINPLITEATKIDLQKKIQDAQAGDLNAINEIMGNLAMAQEMGLPSEAAFANKNLLTMMAARDREANRYQIALENNLMKKYGIDRNYARALTVQAMRGQNALDVASMYTGAYGNGGGVAPGLNRQGTASNVPANYDTMLQAAHNKNNR